MKVTERTRVTLAMDSLILLHNGAHLVILSVTTFNSTFTSVTTVSLHVLHSFFSLANNPDFLSSLELQDVTRTSSCDSNFKL